MSDPSLERMDYLTDIAMAITFVGLFVSYGSMYYRWSRGRLKDAPEQQFMFKSLEKVGRNFSFTFIHMLYGFFLFYFTFDRLQAWGDQSGGIQGEAEDELTFGFMTIKWMGIIVNVTGVLVLIDNLIRIKRYRDGMVQDIDSKGELVGMSLADARKFVMLIGIYIVVQIILFAFAYFWLEGFSIGMTVLLSLIPAMAYSWFIVWYYFWGARKLTVNIEKSKYPPIIQFTDKLFWSLLAIMIAGWFGMAYLYVYLYFLQQ